MNSVKQQNIEVWGLSLRVFHWLLVLSFFIAWWSEGRDMQIHMLAGSLTAGLLLYRLVWGFLGETHARFSSFTPSIPTIKQHLIDLLP
ncbi:MAG: hypothetical protein Q9M20_07475 [Mariprofundaceae bacterium]|nr:hypothetical protein [Mariprofundaceae bacterium]